MAVLSATLQCNVIALHQLWALSFLHSLTKAVWDLQLECDVELPLECMILVLNLHHGLDIYTCKVWMLIRRQSWYCILSACPISSCT